METSELSGTNSPKLSAPEFPVSSSAVSVFCPIYVYFTRSFRCLYRRCLPLPIPNRAVKPARADGTAVTGGRVGRCRSLYRAPAYICRGFFYGRVPNFVHYSLLIITFAGDGYFTRQRYKTVQSLWSILKRKV